MTWQPADPEAPHVEQLIVSYKLRGKGVSPDDPVRRVTQVHRFDGTLLAENDPHTPEPPK